MEQVYSRIDMDESKHNLFEDIEQDNNPSLYGSQISGMDNSGQLKEKPREEGQKQGPRGISSDHNEMLQNSIVLSNAIARMLKSDKLEIDVTSNERLLNSSVVVYSIVISEGNEDKIVVKRRYSEFKSLRDNLARLYPMSVIPPIPEKHSLFTFLITTLDNSKEQDLVDSRKRYFTNFLKDLIFESGPELLDCPILHKFLDPNYELCWSNAIHEPPAILVPDNLLLANPLDPTDQNGLYSLLPTINGFDFDSPSDNLHSLAKFQDDLQKLNDQINFFELRNQDRDGEIGSKSLSLDMNNDNLSAAIKFKTVPPDLAKFEEDFHRNIKVLQDMNRLDSKISKDQKVSINTLVELGGNLNNFALQIHELKSSSNDLSNLIEKFGSSFDSDFLNLESYLFSKFIPNWQEPIHMMIQYYIAALHLIKFYKYKLLQYKLLYKLKFRKYQELSNYTDSFENHINVNNLKALDIDSPTINEAIKKIEYKQKRFKNRGVSHKKSWYGLFGGGKGNVPMAVHTAPVISEVEGLAAANNNPPMADEMPNAPIEVDLSGQFKNKIVQAEKELDKLDQLISLTSQDMCNITDRLSMNFNKFTNHMEKKWLRLMISFSRDLSMLFIESLNNWKELRESLIEMRSQ